MRARAAAFGSWMGASCGPTPSPASSTASAIFRPSTLPRPIRTSVAYATAELSAFLLAWLNGVRGRVLNPARPFSLAGMFDRTAVRYCAAVAGLPTAPWRATDSADESPGLPPTHTTIVLDGRLFGPILPRHLQDACCRLAVLLGVPLLQVAFQHAPGGAWRFVDATAFVDFCAGGRPLAAAIAKVFAT